jgi:hypothetical protein
MGPGNKVGINIEILSFSILSLFILIATVDHKTMAFRLTVRSYRDGFTRGIDDATCDINHVTDTDTIPHVLQGTLKRSAVDTHNDIVKRGFNNLEMKKANYRLIQ